MRKKYKTLLPFSLYEELENLDKLSPDEMNSFLVSLRKYCDSTGKDYGKICKDLDLEEPEWSGKLSPNQIESLNQMIKKTWSSDKDKSWRINPKTGLVDTTGEIRISNVESLKSSPDLMGIKFGVSDGHFSVENCSILNLEGCPREVNGTFRAGSTNIENLIGGPEKVEGGYVLDNCKNLISLEGAPKKVSYFSVQFCRALPSLEGGPEIVSSDKNTPYFLCNDSWLLKNLKGAPKEISGGLTPYFSADNCHGLSSLEGAPVLRGQESIRTPYYEFENCGGLYSLEGLPLEGEYSVKLLKNGLKPEVLKRALGVAKKTKSWIVAYLSMFTDPDFIKTGKAPKDPIRAKLAPDNIKKEVEENGERFVVGLKSIWNDFRVKKILREIEIPDDTKADADLLSSLDDIGL
jgi:hypothetical protein